MVISALTGSVFVCNRLHLGVLGRMASMASSARMNLELFRKHERHPSEYYQMNTKPKGLIYIINNSFISQKDDARIGSEKDVVSLQNLHKNIGQCHVETKKELPACEMKEFLQEAAKSRKKAAYIAVFIMTHGDIKDNSSVVKGEDNISIDVMEIIKMFDVPHLKETPVLMFFQMCRGSKLTDEDLFQKVQEVDEILDGVDDDEQKKFEDELLDSLIKCFPEGKIIGRNEEKCDEMLDNIPFNDCWENVDSEPRDLQSATGGGTPTQVVCPRTLAPASHLQTSRDQSTPNMLVSFSAAKGHPSILTRSGSWYIQDLCSIFHQYADTKDVLSLMDELHNEICSRKPRKPGFRGYSFAARTSHTLRRRLYLFPGLPQ